ncbi:UNKNOWN [Stylonychia lemnae]|uniref:Uncharacterized protein n=1 Tax=Stylonychia lemnae TaxID=5949 RepID=A0A078AML9_STYLE|nr:UNKNOWN [Stylonychia lemnae]|eukprot:CDW82108.1 UNKNOWN [Stylonychia lemnae]
MQDFEKNESLKSNEETPIFRIEISNITNQTKCNCNQRINEINNQDRLAQIQIEKVGLDGKSYIHISQKDLIDHELSFDITKCQETEELKQYFQVEVFLKDMDGNATIKGDSKVQIEDIIQQKYSRSTLNENKKQANLIEQSTNTEDYESHLNQNDQVTFRLNYNKAIHIANLVLSSSCQQEQMQLPSIQNLREDMKVIKKAAADLLLIKYFQEQKRLFDEMMSDNDIQIPTYDLLDNSFVISLQYNEFIQDLEYVKQTLSEDLKIQAIYDKRKLSSNKIKKVKFYNDPQKYDLVTLQTQVTKQKLKIKALKAMNAQLSKLVKARHNEYNQNL